MSTSSLRPARSEVIQHRRTVTLAALFLVMVVPTLAFWTITGVGAARPLRTVRASNVAMASRLVASVVPLPREG